MKAERGEKTEAVPENDEGCLRNALAAAGLATWHWELSTSQISCSENAAILVGQPLTRPISYQTFLGMLHPDDRSQVESALRTALADRNRGQVECRTTWPDGSVHWLCIRGQGRYDKLGTVLGADGVMEDITERKQAKETLHQQLELQDQFTKVAATVPGLICSFKLKPDGSASMPFATEAIRELYGLRPEDVREDFSPILVRIHPDDRAQLQKSIGESALTMQPWRDVFRVRHPEKGERWVEGHSVPRRDPDGSILWHGFVQDITERKQAEEALRESEAKFHTLADNISQLAWLANEQGWIFWYNRRWYEYTGTTSEQMDGWGWQAVHHPETLTLVVERWRASLETGEPFEMEFPLRGGNGEYRWFLTRVMPVKDASGKVYRWFGTNTDITEQKKVREALQSSEQRLLAFLNSTVVIAWIKDEAGRHVFLSDSFQRRFQVQFEDWKGKTDAELWPREIAEEFRRNDLQALTSGKPIEVIERTRESEGIVSFWLNNKFVFTDVSGARYVGGVGVEITERIRAEEDLKKRNEELLRFTYTVSHDLKSPLVTIRTFAGYLEQDIKTGDQTQIREDLDYIHRAAEKMTTLLEELLELSRIGRKMNTFEQVPWTELVKEALELVAGAVAERGVQVVVAESPLCVCVDRQRLVEVFQNLLDNAVKFLGAQPAPRIEVGTEQTGHETVFFVRDNGLGIDPRHRDKLFGLFEKLHPGLPGTGIGLAMVRRIIEVHGGRIWAESAGVGQGTKFCFTLSQTPSLPSNS